MTFCNGFQLVIKTQSVYHILGSYNTFGPHTLNILIADEVKELSKKPVNVAINNTKTCSLSCTGSPAGLFNFHRSFCTGVGTGGIY